MNLDLESFISIKASKYERRLAAHAHSLALRKPLHCTCVITHLIKYKTIFFGILIQFWIHVGQNNNLHSKNKRLIATLYRTRANYLQGVGYFNNLAQLFTGDRPFAAMPSKGIIY